MPCDRPPRVLLVDDEPAFTDLVADVMERTDAGFDVTAVTGSSEALESLREHRFDCVVSDYDMPEMDGLDLLAAIRVEYPGLPFILFTGKGSEEIASEAISAGVTDYLQKGPDQYELLANRIDNAIEKYRSEAELRVFRRAVEHAGHAIFWTDCEGTIEYVNPAFEWMTGYSRAEAIGRTPRIFQSGAHDDAFYERLWDTILSGDVWRGEVLNERKSGERYRVDQTIAPISDVTGRVTRFVSVNTELPEELISPTN